jgi:hypothetical protein
VVINIQLDVFKYGNSKTTLHHAWGADIMLGMIPCLFAMSNLYSYCEEVARGKRNFIGVHLHVSFKTSFL